MKPQMGTDDDTSWVTFLSLSVFPELEAESHAGIMSWRTFV